MGMRITCPCWPRLNENETDNLSLLAKSKWECFIIGYFTIFLFVNIICNVITVNTFLICWHMESLLHPGGHVIICLSVGREQTDVLNLYDWVTCLTRWPLWPVWLGNLYDLYDMVTSLSRWPLSLGDLYELYDWATSMTCMTMWPLSPGDLYHWVTAMTCMSKWHQWLGDLYDLVTSMTGWPPWPCDLYDLNDLVTSMTRQLLWLCGATHWQRLAPFLTHSLPTYFYTPRIHKHSLTLACKHTLTLTEPDQRPRVHTSAN